MMFFFFKQWMRVGVGTSERLRHEKTAEGDAVEADAAEQGDADAEEVGWVAHSPSQAELDPGTPWEADEPVEEETDEDDKAAPTEEAQEGSFGST